MARTCPASSVNATIRAALSAFDAACQQRGAKRTACEKSGNATGSKPRAGKYGSNRSTIRASPKSSSGGFFSARRLLRCRTTRPLASIASRMASRSQPAWHLTAIFPSRSSLTPHDAVLSSCAGQRKSCQPDAEAAPDPPKARAISLAVEKRVLPREAGITRPLWASDDLLGGSVQRRSGEAHLSFGDRVGAASRGGFCYIVHG